MMDLALIKRQLDSLPRGQRRRFVENIAEQMATSADTVYRRLRESYGKQKEISRDVVIPDDWIDWVAQVKAESIRYGTKDRELATKRCIRILERSGKIPAGVLTVSTANRRLEESGLRRRKIAVRYEAEFANQSHQIDFSRAEYAEILGYDAQRGDYIVIINQRGWNYKNKEGKKQHLWLAQVVDEYSRVRLIRYFSAANESALIGLQMFNFVFRRAEDNHPLRYPSWIMRTDNGSFATSDYTKEMLRILEIEWLPSTVGNSRSMGKVERGWRTWWQWELETAMVMGTKNTLYLSELNDLAMAECVRELGEKHPTRGGYRGDLYLRSLASAERTQRIIDADVLDMATKVIERTVSKTDCRVRFNNDFYLAPEKYAGRQVRLRLTAEGKLMGESMDQGERFELTPHQALTMGEYKSYPDTYGERMGKAFDHNELIGDQGFGSAQQAGASAPLSHQGGNRIYMPPKTEIIRPETPFTPTNNNLFSSVDEAREYIGKRLGVPYSAVAGTFDDLLEMTLERSVIEGILKDAI